MTDDLFLITGATGATGSNAIGELLSKGAKVRAFVHTDDARAAVLRTKGVEVVFGDVLDRKSVAAALKDVSGAYFCYPLMQPKLIDGSAFFAEAAKEAGVRSIVNMSQIAARKESESEASYSHWYGERVFDWSGVPVTHIRPALFMEWLMYPFQLPLIANHDLLKSPGGSVHHAPIAAEDQGRVIASLLLNPAEHAGKIYYLYGAVELSYEEIASAISEALDRKIRYESESIADFEARLAPLGIPKYFLQHIVAFYRDYESGIFVGTNNIVEKLTGRKPMTVGEYVKKNIAAFQPTAK
jgi:NAD(P)H dehydrogenase (quinone)